MPKGLASRWAFLRVSVTRSVDGAPRPDLRRKAPGWELVMSAGLGKLGSAWLGVERTEAELKRMKAVVAEVLKRPERNFDDLISQVSQLGRRLTKQEEAWVPDFLVARMRGGGLLTRRETAAVLGCSTRQVQRMETKGKLVRCPNMGSAVRYPAGDVLKLASARPWKED